MTSTELHWLIATYQICPIVDARPSYTKNGFTPDNCYPKYKRPKNVKTSPLTQPIDHWILEGLSVNDIIKQMDLTNSNKTQAMNYIYERKRFLGYRRKSKQMVALEMMKDKKITDEDIAKILGMHKRYVRFLRVENSRGRL